MVYSTLPDKEIRLSRQHGRDDDHGDQPIDPRHHADVAGDVAPADQGPWSPGYLEFEVVDQTRGTEFDGHRQ
jgi:hypothetical protein